MANLIRDEEYGAMPLKDLPEDSYGSGIIDVRNEYDWTMTPQNHRFLTSKMSLIEYELDQSQILNNLKYWFLALAGKIAGNRTDPYKGMYLAKRTGTEYIFPWFEEYNHNISQSWEDFKGLESTDFAENIIKGWALIHNSPGIAINSPKVWKGGGRATIPYKITLFNTTPTPFVSIERNKKLINRLIASSLHDQRGFTLATPPALYVLDIPGVRYSPACVISQLEVSNIGTMVKKGEYGAVPEAWEIKFSLNELLAESRQIFNSGLNRNKKVNAIVEDNKDMEEMRKSLGEYAKSKISFASDSGIPLTQAKPDAPKP